MKIGGAAVLIGVLVVDSSWGAGAELTLADGRVLSATDVRLDPDTGCSVTTGGAAQSLPLDHVVQVRFGRSRDVPEIPAPVVVHLHDGSFLLGRIAGGSEENLVLELALGVRVALSFDAIHGVFLGPRALQSDFQRFEVRDDRDLLFRRPEVGGDFTSGTLVAFTADEVHFEYQLGVGKFPLEEVEAVVLAQQLELPAAAPLAVTADLWPDGSLCGEFERLDGENVTLRPLFGEQVRLPRTLLRGLRFRASGAAWLSDLAPVSVEQIPFLGDPEFFLYPFRVDRSVTGRPLEVAGVRYAKGFGCHSRTRLEFDLEGRGFDHFRVDVGVSDEVLVLADRGSLEFVVLVDGAEAFRSPVLHGGDPAVRTPALPITGARSLVLLTDFGSGGDIADRGVWGDPMLWKSGE